MPTRTRLTIMDSQATLSEVSIITYSLPCRNDFSKSGNHQRCRRRRISGRPHKQERLIPRPLDKRRPWSCGHFFSSITSTPVPLQVGHSVSGVQTTPSSFSVPGHSGLDSQIPSITFFPWHVGHGCVFFFSLMRRTPYQIFLHYRTLEIGCFFYLRILPLT